MPAQVVLAAINREQLAAASRIAAGRGLVVFGTMDGGLLKKINTGGTGVVPVYFYEPG